MEITVDINHESLRKALNDFPKELFNNINLAVQIADRNVQNRARGNHRFKTKSGALEASISTEHDRQNLSVSIGIDTGIAPYGPSIHDGSKAHIIRPKNRKSLRFVKNGRFVFAKKVNHPGTKPDKFIEKAGKQEERNFQQLVNKAVEKSSERVGL